MMKQDFPTIEWNDDLAADCRALAKLAIAEDLNGESDYTTNSLMPPEAIAQAVVAAREDGVASGLRVAEIVLSEFNFDAEWTPHIDDGAELQAGDILATITGPARGLLTVERTILNFLGRMCGVATQTANYVAAVGNSKVGVYDTRKTTPGWRRLEKYAVQCGGGRNHRLALNTAVMIKDNHLAQTAKATRNKKLTPPEAVAQVRTYLRDEAIEKHRPELAEMIVEIEVDTLDQLAEVFTGETLPDIVLLDNMSTFQLEEAVAMRNEQAKSVELEASGGVTIETIPEIAKTGVERISVGALTHSAVNFDVGLDWR